MCVVEVFPPLDVVTMLAAKVETASVFLVVDFQEKMLLSGEDDADGGVEDMCGDVVTVSVSMD